LRETKTTLVLVKEKALVLVKEKINAMYNTPESDYGTELFLTYFLRNDTFTVKRLHIIDLDINIYNKK